MSEANEKIYRLANDLRQLRENKKCLEEHLKEINSDIKDIEEKTLSNLLDEEGISKISLDDLEISKSLIFRGGYTKHTNPDAFKFLFDTDNQGALKQIAIIDLAAYPGATIILDDCDIAYKVEYSIHHMTLSSIIKELVESGKFSTDDIEKYNVYIQPQIKVKQKN